MSQVSDDQYLTFFLGDEEFAVPVLSVREIVEYGAVTRVPSTPSWIRGVINLRGSVVTVVDLAIKFGLPSAPLDRRTCIVIVETTLNREETVMGVVADAVDEVATLSGSEIEPPPPFGTAVRVEFLVGMARAGRKFLQLLDIDKVLSVDELLAARDAADAPREEPAAEQAGEAGELEPDRVMAGEKGGEELHAGAPI